MAYRLLELGSIDAHGNKVSPVVDVFSFVNTVEDPFAWTGQTPQTGQQVAIAERLRSMARTRRREILNPHALRGLGSTFADEMPRLRGILAATAIDLMGLDEDYELGKKKKRGFKKIAKVAKSVSKKVVKVVKSPAFLSVVGLAANLIPGVGQVASAGLLAAAAARQKKVEGKKADKAEKRANQASVQAQFEELDRFYNEYKTEYLIPMGYTPDVWSGMSLEERTVTAQQLAEGKLQPYKGPVDVDKSLADFYAANKGPLSAKGYTDPVWASLSKDDKLGVVESYSQGTLEPYKPPADVVQAAATSQAMQQVYGSSLPGQGMQNLPPAVQKEAAKEAPGIADQIRAAGPDNFLEAAFKSIGQAGAIGNLFKGSGAEMPAGLNELVGMISGGGSKIQAAVGQGQDDLLNTAATDGDTSVQETLERANAIPWTPILIVGGTGLAVIATALALSRSRR